MARRTPQQELAHQMQKMKDMGVTISVKRGSDDSKDHAWTDAIAAGAKAAGIYEEKSN